MIMSFGRFGFIAGCTAATVFAPIATAEPIVLRWPAGVESVDLSAVDPTLPSLELERMISDPGAGVGDHWHPFLRTPGLLDGGCNLPENRVEFTESFDYQEFAYGDPIDGGLPDWESAVYCFDLDNPWFGIVSFEDPFFGCGTGTNGCPPVASSAWFFFDELVQCVPLRFENDAGGWNYGWFAFTIVRDGLPGCNACEPDEPLPNDSWLYIGFGYETEPNTAIINGGGLCEADVNSDAVLDLADVQGFAQAFLSGGTAADLNADGVFDLADVQRFIGSFQDGCGL